MSQSLLISLIIPTRERAWLLRECLKTATAIQDDMIEIVVSDNASRDNTDKVVSSVSDSRVRYINTGRRVSMRQNFDFAFENCKGTYVIYVGDDDGFLPAQFPFLRQILAQRRPDVLAWNPVRYEWPTPGARRPPGKMRIKASAVYAAEKVVSFDSWRGDILQGQNTYPDALPSVYHGCLSRAILEEVRSRCGHAFAASSPDVFSSYYVALTRPSYMRVGHAFTINGRSCMSTGASTAAFHATGDKEDPASKFASEMESDVVRDAIECKVPSLGVNLFATFESARRIAGVQDERVSFPGWYSKVLGDSMHLKPLEFEGVMSALSMHAKQLGKELELSQAVETACGPVAEAKGAWWRLKRSLSSIKCSGVVGAENTVYTAAARIDSVLSTEYGKVRLGNMSPLRAWLGARFRSFRDSART